MYTDLQEPISLREKRSLLTESSGSVWESGLDQPREGSARPYARLLQFLAVAVISSLLTFWITISHGGSGHGKGVQCGDMYIEDPSPLKTLDRSWHLKTFNPFNYTASKFTQHPSAGDVDAEWNSLGLDSGHFLIPVSQAQHFGLDRKRHLVLPVDAPDVMEESFAVSLDVMHHLHCLDSLRQALWYNREWYVKQGGAHAKKPIHIAHTDHCLDALRERLMCLSDITILPQIWIDREGGALPDFERQHQCHDFEAVRRWAYQNQMPVSQREKVFLPADDAVMTVLPGKVELYRKYGIPLELPSK